MMKRVVRRATKHVYKYAIKPVLFKQHPDNVHKRLIKVAKRTQRIPVVKRLPKLWAYQAPVSSKLYWAYISKTPLDLPLGLTKILRWHPL